MAAYVVFDTDNPNKKKLIKDIEAESKMNLKHHLESFPSADLKIISPLIVEKGEVGNSVLKKCSAEVVAKLSSKGRAYIFLNIFILYSSFYLPLHALTERSQFYIHKIFF